MQSVHRELLHVLARECQQWGGGGGGGGALSSVSFLQVKHLVSPVNLGFDVLIKHHVNCSYPPTAFCSG